MITRITGISLAAWVCLLDLGFPAHAQNSTSINLNLQGTTGGSFSIANWALIGQTGSVAPLGNANLTVTSSSEPDLTSSVTGPAQVTAVLAFNEADTLTISFTLSDPNFLLETPVMMPGGVITTGTGAYAGASGSLDVTLVNTLVNGQVTGTGTLILGGTTTPLTLSNFQGACCGSENRQSNIFSLPLKVSGSLGSASGTMVGYWSPTSTTQQTNGTATINFNSSDSLTLGFTFTPAGSANFNGAPSTFSGNIAAGTGRFANASGSLTWKVTLADFSVSGTMTTAPGAAITDVKTIYGLPQVAYNTWIEVHGKNLVPADTPSTGVNWSNAPDFANGQMPTQLGPISVYFGALPGYVYYYCSAVTNPNCADDQINVLAPLLSIQYPGPERIMVENNGVPLATTATFKSGFSPAFLVFDTVGHVVAQHLDYSLVGPPSLYPGLTRPAEAGETIIRYATSFGPTDTTIVAGSATQSGNISSGLRFWVSGFYANVAGALTSPGLYQLNLTVPKGLPSGDHAVVCQVNFYSTFPGSVITVQ
ncbi:MAG TPA: hypothetical protein VIY49_18365 [Bryobacteraceae bacterium]